MTLDKRYGLINPDASIYESIKEFARKNKGIKIHLNKNTDDFDKPIIHKELNGLGVELYSDSGKVVDRVKALID